MLLSKDNDMQTDQPIQISGKGGDLLPSANRKRGEMQKSKRLVTPYKIEMKNYKRKLTSRNINAN